MKKITASFLVCLLLFGPLARPSHSLVMVPPLAIAGAATLAIMAGYAVYRSPDSFSMASLGNAASSVYFSIRDDLIVKGALLTTAADIYAELAGKPSTYPASQPLLKNSEIPLTGMDVTIGVTTVITPDGQTKTVTGLSVSNYLACTNPLPVVGKTIGNYQMTTIENKPLYPETAACSNAYQYLVKTYNLTLSSQYNPPSLAKFEPNLNGLPTYAGAARTEIDAAIGAVFKQNNGNVNLPVLPEVPINVVDADRGGPLSAGLLNGLKDRAVTVDAAQEYERKAVAAAAVALATAQSARALADAQPADSGLAVAAAIAAAASGAAALAASQATSASATALKSLGDSVAAGAVVTAKAETAAAHSSAPVKKTLDWTKFNALKTVLMTKFPFTLVTGLTAQFALLNSGSGVAPAFDLPLPLRNTIRVDLAIFNPIAIVIRYLLGVAVTIGLTLYIVRFWRGN